MANPHPGQWEIVMEDSHVTAIHAHLLPNGKVLYFDANHQERHSSFQGLAI